MLCVPFGEGGGGHNLGGSIGGFISVVISEWGIGNFEGLIWHISAWMFRACLTCSPISLVFRCRGSLSSLV